MVANRNYGGISATAMDVADARNAAGCFPGRRFTEAPATESRDVATTATLALARAFCRKFYTQQPVSQRPRARRSDFWDVVCCHFGSTFVARAEWDAKHAGQRHVRGTVPGA